MGAPGGYKAVASQCSHSLGGEAVQAVDGGVDEGELLGGSGRPYATIHHRPHTAWQVVEGDLLGPRKRRGGC